MKKGSVVILLCGLAVAQQADAAETQRFVPYVYVDPVSGLEAFRCLVPKGWKVEGGISWSANPALPAQSQFRFWDPQSLDELNLFPAQAYFWTDNRLLLATNPWGTLRFNTLVAPPVDLAAAFSRIVLPSARGKVPRITVTSRQQVPELAALARGEATPGVNSSADAGKVRVRYLEGGQAFEEEFYAAVANPGKARLPRPALPDDAPLDEGEPEVVRQGGPHQGDPGGAEDPGDPDPRPHRDPGRPRAEHPAGGSTA